MADIVRRRPASVRRSWDWPLRRFFEEMFEPFERDWGLPELWSEDRFVPAIDVTEDKDSLTLTAEVPGMDKDDLEVSIENGVLTLRGEKKEETRTEDANYHRVERRYGHFERRIRLPDYVDAEKVDATYKDGVLKLRMPKSETARPKSIPIK